MNVSAPSLPYSLYVHVPFCARKCEYCAFYSGPAGREVIDRYVSALIRELEMRDPRRAPETIFFGGGTPSILTASQWERIFEAFRRLGLNGAKEWTIECNPATVSTEKARLWLSAGVNRVSMGIQSLDDRVLQRLGRVHSRETALESYRALREAGFRNVNIDLMFAVPGQGFATWAGTLTEALRLESEHLACYEVIYEEDTPLFEQLRAGRISVNDDLACDMYEELIRQAVAAGYHHYEVANFARGELLELEPGSGLPRFACHHNVNYWRGGEFLGLGPSATSYLNGVRAKNCEDTQRYCEAVEQGRLPVEASEELSALGRAGETAAFGLRMLAGWGFDEFTAITRHDLRTEWAVEMDELVERGWAERSPSRFSLTARGIRFADAAGLMFLR